MLEAAKDVAIILLAVQSFVIGGVLIVLLLQVRSLVRLLQEEVRPILASAQDTVGTVQGTTTVVSKYVVSPIARLAALATGLREGLDSLAGRTPPDDLR